MVPPGAQQLVARRDLHEDGDVPARGDRHPDHRNGHAEDLEPLLVETQPVVLAARLPPFELHDELDALRAACRGDAEEIADVDDAQPADFHVVPRQLRAAPEQHRVGPPADLDRIVRDEPMAADDEVERALALADAALPHHQDAEAEDVEEHAMDHAPHRQVGLEAHSHPRDRDRRRQRRLEHGDAGPVRLVDQLGRRREGIGDDHAGDAAVEHAANRGAADVGSSACR